MKMKWLRFEYGPEKEEVDGEGTGRRCSSLAFVERGG